MRPVSTIRSVVSCCGTSRSGRWIVTGTTASSGDHSIITGCAARPVRFLRELGEKFGVAGLGEAGAVEHGLGDRIGDDRVRAPGEHIGDRAADRGDRGRARSMRPDVPGSAVTVSASATTGSAPANAAAAVAARRRAIGTSRPSSARAPREKVRIGRADRTAAAQARRAAARPQA